MEPNMNQEILDVINKHERIKDFYNVGPVQRAVLQDFIEDIFRVADNGYYADFHQFLIDFGYIEVTDAA